MNCLKKDGGGSPVSKDPTITIIILHYRALELTIDCIESCLQTTYPSYDILVFDNGSADGSDTVLQKKYAGNKKITVRSIPKNRAFTGGFNAAARLATGEKIVLLSNDMVVDPDWLTHLARVAKKNEKYIVQPKIMDYYQKDRIDNVGGAYTWWGIGCGIGHGETDRGQYDKNAELDYASATTLMIDRTFFLEIGGYDEWFWSHYEDVDLAFRAKKAGGKCFLCYRSRIYHLGSATYKKIVPGTTVLFHGRKNRLKVILKHFHGPQKLFRIGMILVTMIPLIAIDLTHADPKRKTVTIRAIYTAFTS